VNENLSRSNNGKLRRPVSSNTPLTWAALIVPDCILAASFDAALHWCGDTGGDRVDVLNSKQAGLGQ